MDNKEAKAIKLKIRDEVPLEKRLTQLAEECCEGAQAALKLRRAYDGEAQLKSPECRIKLIEEMVDILICMDVIMTDLDSKYADEIYEMKLKRWEKRLKDASKS